MARDTFDDPRLTAAGLLLEAHQGLTAMTAPAYTGQRLSGVEFDVLIRLARSPDQRLRMTDLAAQTSLSTSGATRVVDRLEKGGLLVRQPCPGDRRGAFAALTEAGAEQLASGLPALLEAIERWFTGLLAPDELAAMLDAMYTVRNTVRPGATAGAGADCCA